MVIVLASAYQDLRYGTQLLRSAILLENLTLLSLLKHLEFGDAETQL
jgi:hypothetical protein